MMATAIEPMLDAAAIGECEAGAPARGLERQLDQRIEGRYKQWKEEAEQDRTLLSYTTSAIDRLISDIR